MWDRESSPTTLLETFGGAGVVRIPEMQKLLRYICENGFEHHVAANFSQVAAAVAEATVNYLSWKVHVAQALSPAPSNP